MDQSTICHYANWVVQVRGKQGTLTTLMKDNAEKFQGAPLAIITGLSLFLILLNSAPFSLPSLTF